MLSIEQPRMLARSRPSAGMECHLYVPVALFDFFLRGLRLNSQCIVELGLLYHGWHGKGLFCRIFSRSRMVEECEVVSSRWKVDSKCQTSTVLGE